MTFLTRPFLTFVFVLEPVWIPVLALDLVTMLVLIFTGRFTPRTLIFWISVVVPFLGVLLYILFGNGIYSGRVFGRQQRRDEDLLGGPMVDLPDDVSTSAVPSRASGVTSAPLATAPGSTGSATRWLETWPLISPRPQHLHYDPPPARGS